MVTPSEGAQSVRVTLHLSMSFPSAATAKMTIRLRLRSYTCGRSLSFSIPYRRARKKGAYPFLQDAVSPAHRHDECAAHSLALHHDGPLVRRIEHEATMHAQSPHEAATETVSAEHVTDDLTNRRTATTTTAVCGLHHYYYCYTDEPRSAASSARSPSRATART